mmetsp:Transcript_127012/g.367669  ORF Transcript_127012/g.367669 Transcript_127012/m.367669 type:complete len:260 (-) Transcript_127012:671-1450(-)
MSCDNSAIWVVRSSTCALSFSTSSVFASRVNLFVASSASHQPLCSVSWVASSMSLTMRSLIIFLTFTNGSSATRWETMDNKRLSMALALTDRNVEILCCKGLAWLARNCDNDLVPRFCNMLGRCFFAAPETFSDDSMSMACWMASSSSPRSFCLDSKSEPLTLHMARISLRYFSSSALSDAIWARSPECSALYSWVSARRPVFFEISCLAFSMLSVNCWYICSKACLEFISSRSSSYFLVPNSSFSFSSMSTTLPDWNS